MITEIITKIMLTGLKKFNKEFGQTEEKQAQIHVSMLQDGSIIYKKAFDWVPIAQVKFTEIMDKRCDLLGYQSLSKPFMQISINNFSQELNTSIENVSVFIFENNNIVYLAIYNEDKFIRHLTLEKHLENLGL